MKRYAAAIASFMLFVLLGACAGMSKDSGWITLLDGSKPNTLNDWRRLGDANWRVEDGLVIADKGTKNSYIVSKDSFRDFQLRAEFWAESNTNSGIHVRSTNPSDIQGENSYEFNIYDIAPAPEFGTGAITRHGKVTGTHKAGGRWNTYVITAKGDTLTAELNGVQTIVFKDSKFGAGPIALQWGVLPKNVPGGPIKFRKVEVKPL